MVKRPKILTRSFIPPILCALWYVEGREKYIYGTGTPGQKGRGKLCMFVTNLLAELIKKILVCRQAHVTYHFMLIGLRRLCSYGIGLGREDFRSSLYL